MANWPIDPGRQIQWAKQPGYTARLLSLVASLDHRADRHCVFTPKGTGKARIIADVTDKLFCTLPYDHDRVEKQRASVQRRINQFSLPSPCPSGVDCRANHFNIQDRK